MKINDSDLLFSVQRSFLFNLTRNVRYVFYEHNIKKNCINLLIYTREPSIFEEKEAYISALGEIEGDYRNLECGSVEVVATKKKYDDIKKLENLFIAENDYL